MIESIVGISFVKKDQAAEYNIEYSNLTEIKQILYTNWHREWDCKAIYRWTFQFWANMLKTPNPELPSFGLGDSA